jgi:predicted deacetylase
VASVRGSLLHFTAMATVRIVPSSRALVATCAAMVALAGTGAVASTPAGAAAPGPETGESVGSIEARGQSADPGARATTLVLYDDSGPYGWLGELYGIAVANLVSHFGAWTAKPVRNYTQGDMRNVTATVYVGSTYDEPLPAAFLADVVAGQWPVVWVGENAWQLETHAPRFPEWFGFAAGPAGTVRVNRVRYKGVDLVRQAANPAGITSFRRLDAGRVEVLAMALREDGVQVPWAVRSRNLTVVGDNPFVFVGEDDRYLAFCDLLFDVLAPETPQRHRALVRIEDVSPLSNPRHLRAIADALAAERVPFSVAVIPVHVDPRTRPGTGKAPRRVRMRDAPKVADALRYMISRGGTLILHGYTHQYETRANPYSGVSGEDFEFWMAHLDGSGTVVLDGPVPDDSAERAAGRARTGIVELVAAGLPAPEIFEFPHYAGSGVDARALAAVLPTGYHAGMYFRGSLRGITEDHSRTIYQSFPYVVRDVYGWRILPANLGGTARHAPDRRDARLPEGLVREARTLRVVRDGVASLFFHHYLDPRSLIQVVKEMQLAGYFFVSPGSL